MEEKSVEQLGPVDYMVVEFPLGKADLSGEMATELKSLVDRDLIQVMDLLLIEKDADGSIEAYEVDQLEKEQAGVLHSLDSMALELLAEEDVHAIAAALEPGTLAAVLVWENSWAAPFASSIRQSGGQLVANGRIPVQGILAALEADEKALATEGV